MTDVSNDLGDGINPAIEWTGKEIGYCESLHRKLLAGHTPWGNRSLAYQPGKNKKRRGAGDRWSTVVLRVFRRDKFTCVYCGARGCDLECDHIIPVSRGGDDLLENLATACRACNQAKGSLTILEWRALS